MKKILFKILVGALVASQVILGIAFTHLQATPNLGSAVPQTVAFFQTSLQGSIGATDNAMTLVSGTTPDGTSLSGFYGFVIDEGSSSQEVVTCTATATALTGCTRGISSITGNTTIAALEFAHRRGASVKITTSPIVLILTRQAAGTEGYPSKLKYDSHPDFTGTAASTSLIDRYYADNLAIAGAPVASTIAKGIVQEATVAQTNSGTGTGSTGARLFVTPSDIASSSWYAAIPTTNQGLALSGTLASPSATNKFLTFNNTYKGLGTLSASSKLLAFTLTASAQGDVLFRGASGYQNLAASASGNFLMSNGAGTSPTWSNPGSTWKVGNFTKDVSGAGTTVVTHGLGHVPKIINFSATGKGGVVPITMFGTYANGTQNSVYTGATSNNNFAGTDTSNALHLVLYNNTNSSELGASGLVTVSSVSFTITWTLLGGGGIGTAQVMWSAQ